MNIHGGYIYIAKSLLDSDLWFCSSNTLKVAVYLLVSASFKNDPRKGLERGQCWKTLGIISEDCNISLKAVRCALDKLRDIDFIETNSTHRGARSGQRITICNYNKFQSASNYIGAGEGHSEGHPKGQAKGQHYNEENEGNEETKLDDECQNPDLFGFDDEKPTKRKERIFFDYDSEQIQGIEKEDIDEWQQAFPAVEITLAIMQAKQWLQDNPKKRKKDVSRFLTNWFSRAQERGGGAAKRGDLQGKKEDFISREIREATEAIEARKAAKKQNDDIQGAFNL